MFPSVSGLREQQPWSSPAWSRPAGSPAATSIPVAVNKVAPHQFIANGSIGEARPAPDASLRVGTRLLSDEITATTRARDDERRMNPFASEPEKTDLWAAVLRSKRWFCC